jgi:hypothetical protein
MLPIFTPLFCSTSFFLLTFSTFHLLLLCLSSSVFSFCSFLTLFYSFSPSLLSLPICPLFSPFLPIFLSLSTLFLNSTPTSVPLILLSSSQLFISSLLYLPLSFCSLPLLSVHICLSFFCLPLHCLFLSLLSFPLSSVLFQ